MIRRILDWFRRTDVVSAQWRHEHAQRDGREGWDGPEWKTPQQIAVMRRLERKKDLRLVKKRA